MPRNKTLTILILIAIVSTLFTIPPISAKLLDEEYTEKIHNFLIEVDKNTTVEIVIYTITSLEGHGIKYNDGSEINEIKDLAETIFNDIPLELGDGRKVKGIGKGEWDNGILILVAIEDRKVKIETGYGIMGDITVFHCNDILDEHFIPAFQEGNYGEGLYNTAVALATLIKSYPVEEYPGVRGKYIYDYAYEDQPGTLDIPWWGWILIAIVVIVIFAVLVKSGITFKSGGSSSDWNGGSNNGRRESSHGGEGKSGGGGPEREW